ncbi:MAG: NADP-dependent 3-hydroxy acid dehydrogenase YdfG [Pseudomonadota bacterium]|jgi:NADP-dependent 3-hydroxy acid dehydrogenase YdfG
MSVEKLINDALRPRCTSLRGQTALITGASSGIGLALAARLAQEGCHLHLIARRQDRLSQLSIELKNLFPELNIRTFPLDVTREETADVLESAGAFEADILINNAGLAKGLAKIIESDASDWSEMLSTNVNAAFTISARAARAMSARKSGDIVVLSSVAAHHSYENGAVYCASKHAVRAFHEALRLETLESGIRVIMISPGMVETEFSLVRFSGDNQRANAVYQGVESLDAGDVAESILFALRQPRHINLDDIIIKPRQQGNPWRVFRNS